MLLYDMATSSSVLSFLKMKQIPTLIRNLPNAEFMSRNGRLPVVIERDNDKIMCGFTDVFWHISHKLDYTPTLLELAYLDWVESKFLEAEMYICWCHERVLAEYTQVRFQYDLPWPISTILFNRKRKQITNDVGKKFVSFEDFLDKFNQFLSHLNKRIGNKPYCLSEKDPSCVDALIYGHTKAITGTRNLDPRLTDAITKQRRVINLTNLIDKAYPS